MLYPLQSAPLAAAASTMQGILDTIGDRQREEAEKANGRKNDAFPAPSVQSDETARQANARVNEHFFGSRARDTETIATLVSRLSAVLGVSQRPEETGRAFAQRLSDLVTLADTVRTNGREPPQVTLASLGTTLAAVQSALGGGQANDPAAMLVARLALSQGVAQEEGEADADFSDRLSAMLTRLRGEIPESKEAIERQTGLSRLGLKVEDLLAALRDPYGSAARHVKDALAEKAEAEKALTPEMRKTLARLEDTAAPKTIEELKLERTRRDLTRVEDAETRAEREEDIRARETAGKLEEVRDLQEAMGEVQKKQAAGGAGDGETDGPSDALSAIQLLASGLAATQAQSGEGDATGDETEDAAETSQDALRGIEAEAKRQDKERRDAAKDIFTLRVDENGIYDLITRQLAG